MSEALDRPCGDAKKGVRKDRESAQSSAHPPNWKHTPLRNRHPLTAVVTTARGNDEEDGGEVGEGGAEADEAETDMVFGLMVDR